MLPVLTLDCKNNGRCISDITHWFGDCCFDAGSLAIGRHHLVFLEPEVTIFGQEGGAGEDEAAN